jgi:preprotein translocase subunit SecE
LADEPDIDAPDEDEPAPRTRAGSGGSVAGATPAPKSKGFVGASIQFIRECWAELGRVQWPDRSQLWQATAVVILACLVVGVYLYALDSVFAEVAEWLVNQQAS